MVNLKCVIMRACSGAGKSTFIKNYFPKAIVVSADDFWLDKDGNYKFDPKRLGEAHAWALRRFVYEVQLAGMDGEDTTIVVDNTNTTVAELAPYYAVASAHGFDTQIVTLDVDEDTANARNVHNVPQEACHRQRRNLVQNNDFIPKFWKHKVLKPGTDGFCRL